MLGYEGVVVAQYEILAFFGYHKAYDNQLTRLGWGGGHSPSLAKFRRYLSSFFIKLSEFLFKSIYNFFEQVALRALYLRKYISLRSNHAIFLYITQIYLLSTHLLSVNRRDIAVATDVEVWPGIIRAFYNSKIHNF